MKSLFKYLTLALICLSVIILWLWILQQGMTALNWLFLPSILVWALLMAFWYLGFGKAPFKIRGRRFLTGIISFVVVGFILSKLFRYEGSASGSSFPKFSWAFSEPAGDSSPANATDTIQTEQDATKLVAAQGELLQFFGPQRNGTWENRRFNGDWDTTPPELIWRRPIGAGWSSFAVSGTLAVTHEQVEDNECVSCLDLHTGETLWQHRDVGVRLLLSKAGQGDAAMGGEGPRSTPTIHQDRVYALGSTGILNCLKLESGEKIWSRNILSEFNGSNHKWGMANAPLILAELNLLVIPGTDSPGINLIALNLDSGETAWTSEGRGASYSSPRLLEFDGADMIVSVNGKDVTGHDPASGEILWTFDWPGNFPRVGQPLKIGANQLLFTASYGMGSPLLTISKEGDSWTAEQVWKSTRLKTKFSSAHLVGSRAIGLDEGRLAAINLSDGTIAWKGDKYGFGQHLLFGDQFLIQSESGAVVTGTLTEDSFTETGRIDDALTSMTWNAPAVAGRFLLVRNDREAVCYLLPPVQ